MAQLRKIKRTAFNVPSPFQPGRTVKMGMPACEICQAGRAPQDWYLFCPHNPPAEGDTTTYRNQAGGNPYVTRSETAVKTRDIEVQPDGTRLIKGVIETLVEVETDNITQVPYEMRSDSGKGVQMAQAGGCLLPEKLGIAPFCQYRECWSQEIKVRNPQFGDYCSPEHARLSIANILGTTLEILDNDRRQAQLMEIAI
jgi:hypothetical protein